MNDVMFRNLDKLSVDQLRVVFAGNPVIKVSDLNLPNQDLHDLSTVLAAIDNHLATTEDFNHNECFGDLVQFTECKAPGVDNWKDELYLVNLPNLRLVSRAGTVHYFRVVFTSGYFEKYGKLGVRLATRLVVHCIARWTNKTGVYINRNEYTDKVTNLVPALSITARQRESVSLTIPDLHLQVTLGNGLQCKTIRESRISRDKSLIDSYFFKIKINSKESIGLVTTLTDDIPLDLFVTPEMLHQFGESTAMAVNQGIGGNIQISFALSESYVKLRRDAKDKIIRQALPAGYDE